MPESRKRMQTMGNVEFIGTSNIWEYSIATGVCTSQITYTRIPRSRCPFKRVLKTLYLFRSMKIPFLKILLFLPFIVVASCSPEKAIDREALVNRHKVINSSFDSLGSLTVGNGGFAFTVDFTGLQTFPEEYSHGIPLGTQSDWGWHSFPNDSGYRIEETLISHRVDDRDIPYSVQIKDPPRLNAASDYFRINPHRLHLGIVGFNLTNAEGAKVGPEDISEINQVLDIWNGEIRSSFKVMGEDVEVMTLCHPEKDAVSFRARSKLFSSGRISIEIRFPYPSGMHADMACRWNLPGLHSSRLDLQGDRAALIERKLDSTRYFAKLQWTGDVLIKETEAHTYELSSASDQLSVSIEFCPQRPEKVLESFEEIRLLASESWLDFWMSGGAVDFSGSLDPRAEELERRVVLSQYLTRAQCAGAQPPQETGLTYNSWYGKFHLEMAWWHMVHFFLWNRPMLMEESLSWYETIAHKAEHTAIRQGYKGMRWQKMTDPYGNDSPSSVGSYLIWQQPHVIYFAELSYRQFPETATLNRFRHLVFATADFMASYARSDPDKSRYDLGPPLIPAQECFDPQTTVNPPFELAYWYWGLKTAIRWAERLDLPPHPEWEEVLSGLPPLHQQDSLYVPAESVPNAYRKGTHMHDHPAVLGAFGALPYCPLYEKEIMQQTFDYIWENWNWEQTWGWDFPLTSMTAVRLNQPERAMDALFMNPLTNTYLPNGHNYQTERLRLYLPGNGGLLATVALMCAGYDGCTIPNPGIPRNGLWNVKWEGLSPMP